MFFCL